MIHLHCDYLGYVALRRAGVPFLATLHGRLDLPELKTALPRVLRRAGGLDLGRSARAVARGALHRHRTAMASPSSCCCPAAAPAGYLAFLGRISPEKAPDRAIRIAQRRPA